MKKNDKKAPSPLSLTRRATAALKRAGEDAAYQVVCGTGRGSGNQTIKSYAWREGYRVRIDEGQVIVNYQIDFDWHSGPQEKIRRKTAEFVEILQAAGLICFVTEAGHISVAGVKEKDAEKATGKNETAELPLWANNN